MLLFAGNSTKNINTRRSKICPGIKIHRLYKKGENKKTGSREEKKFRFEV